MEKNTPSYDYDSITISMAFEERERRKRAGRGSRDALNYNSDTYIIISYRERLLDTICNITIYS